VLGCTLRRVPGRGALAGAAVLAAGLVLATGALGDTRAVPPSASLPGTDPVHQSPLELLASRIASRIAGRTVSVRCESDADWANLVTQAGGDPAGESGFVATDWNGSTGQLLSISSVAELSSAIRAPLQQFAAAAVKPTKCTVRRGAPAAGPRRNVVSRSTRTAIVPCYLGADRTAAAMPQAYWSDYENDAIAILTLAHESVHLGGTVGGMLANGLAVGDQHAEAKADCYGMQWMPYVAEQLGDTADDAHAIARYFWDKIYPLSLPAHAQYWSADCRPGGALDERPSGTAAWP
jgi:hypothetical protein